LAFSGGELALLGRDMAFRGGAVASWSGSLAVGAAVAVWEAVVGESVQ
jgi:hypothetical protein